MESARVDGKAGRRAQLATASLIVGVAVASVAYRVIVGNGLEQTAALFVGLPTLLALVIVFMTSPSTATGVICKAITIALLVSLVLLWEGILCVAMSAPLFYAVGVVVGLLIDWGRQRWAKRSRTTIACVVGLLVPMSLEGVTEMTSLKRDESVTVTKIVHASTTDVERAIIATPRFDRPLPLFLRAGFPRPTVTRIDRESQRWTIGMTGGEMYLDGMEPRTGDLALQVEEVREGIIRWRVVGDTSHMTHFLDWRGSTVQWELEGDASVRVTWTIRYRRGLDPAWYFGPWERYAARLAADYLIDAVATP